MFSVRTSSDVWMAPFETISNWSAPTCRGILLACCDTAHNPTNILVLVQINDCLNILQIETLYLYNCETRRVEKSLSDDEYVVEVVLTMP